MISVCLVADTHFYDERFAKNHPKGKRPFDTVEEMNESLIKRWNTVVKDDDIVIHLGDVFKGGTNEQHDAIIQRLKGRKILVTGNHDTRTPQEYLSMGFSKVVTEPWTVGMYTFSHEFVPAQELIDRGSRYNLHGHSHKHDYGDPYFNFCIDVTGGYKPKRAKLNVTIEDLMIEEAKYV